MRSLRDTVGFGHFGNLTDVLSKIKQFLGFHDEKNPTPFFQTTQEANHFWNFFARGGKFGLLATLSKTYNKRPL